MFGTYICWGDLELIKKRSAVNLFKLMIRSIKTGAFLLLMLLSFSNIIAQNISIPDTLKGWDNNWVARLNGSQATYSNWSQGGVSSVSGTAASQLTFLNRKNKRGYGFRLNLKYGQSYIQDEGFRKTDDAISIRNRLTNNFEDEDKLAVYFSSLFQTQFDKGYEYGGGEADQDSLISKVFSPAYFSESMGVAFTPKEYFTAELGVGLKQTVVLDDSLTGNYGLEPGENFRSEGGVSAGINFEKEIFKNISYSSSFETFTNLLNGLKKTDIAWSNEIAGKINKTVQASSQFELKYDDDFSEQLQVKQVLSVGISLDLH